MRLTVENDTGRHDAKTQDVGQLNWCDGTKYLGTFDDCFLFTVQILEPCNGSCGRCRQVSFY